MYVTAFIILSALPLLYSEGVAAVRKSAGSSGCDEMEERVAEADRNTVTLYPPNVQGKWVSDRCESREGPEYLLRWHGYNENETYSALSHLYRDPSCSIPWYSLLVTGQLELSGRSWLAPASAGVSFTPTVIVLLPHSQKGAEELFLMLNASCRGLPKRWRWRAGTEYTVYTSRETADTAPGLEGRDWWLGDDDCLKPLRLDHKNVSFLRIQVRPPGPPDAVARTELLLGEATPRGTRLQTPLLFLSQAAPGCPVCSAVDRSSLQSPPLLSPASPLHMAGEWLSTRCEARPTGGLYLKRRLRVSGVRWEADYKFYSDPRCTGPTLTASAEGRMSEVPGPRRVKGASDLDFSVSRAWLTLHDEALIASLSSSSAGCGPPALWKVRTTVSESRCTGPTLTASAEGRMSEVPGPRRVKGASDLDFSVSRAWLTLHDEALIASLSSSSAGCGPPALWKVGVRRDLTSSGGCSALGIVVPTVEYELVRLELDPSGQALLYLGQSGERKKTRPTAFQPPLLQCDAPELPPLTHFLNSMNQATPSLGWTPSSLSILLLFLYGRILI